MNSDVAFDMLKLFSLGIKDSFSGAYNFYKLQKSRSLLKLDKPSELQVFGWSTLQSTIFWIIIVNGVLLGCSDLILHQVFLAGVKLWLYVWSLVWPDVSENVWFIFSPTFTSWFPFLWLCPLFLISRVANIWWFQDIANLTFKDNKPSKLSATVFIADLLCTMVVEGIYLVQCGCMSFIPGIGFVLCFVHLCLLNSLYAFEYKWFHDGWQLPKRLRYIECNWPYYLGFGLPLAALTSFSTHRLLNLCIFAFLFPMYIISGNNSKPATARYSYPIPVFSVSSFLTDKCVENLLSRALR